jgi:hypothetical protein
MNNTLLQSLVETAKTNIPGIIVKDADFFLSGLDKFNMAIISNDEESTKQEPDYGSLLPESFASAVISTADDIPVHYIHIMGHKKCPGFWGNSPVKSQDFEDSQVEFMDEVYIQRLASEVAPTEYRAYPEGIEVYDQMFGQTSSARTLLNSLLTNSANSGVPQSLQSIHQSLYTADPLLQETFNAYVAGWAQALKDPAVKDLVDSYNS